MCGIFGFTGPSSVRDLAKYALTQRHRGPDAFGEYLNERLGVYLAHNRLAIIDLSEKGKQPMSNENGSIWLTFNGEIYNFEELRKDLIGYGHRFKSRTDSEVILHAYEQWGTECLKRLNGMFAFAIWDENRQNFFIARDRLGIKPLYYLHQAGNFVFASEPKAIIELPFYKKDISYPALFSYLIYRYIPGECSIWKNILRLEPGHYLIYDKAGNLLTKRRYWQIPLEQKRWKEDDAVECLDSLIKSSVSYNLISDVPIGILLSGGIDSTAITSYASSLAPHINTFSIGFHDFQRSELKDAAVVARHFKTTHSEDRVSPGNIQRLKDIFNYFDEPLGDSSIIPTFLVSKIAKKHTTVVLSGDGGDELFGGYKWYERHRRLMQWKPLACLFHPVLKLLKGRGSILGHTRDAFGLYRQMTSPRFTVRELKRLFPAVKNEDFPESENYIYRRHYKKDLPVYKRWQYIDAMTFLADDILTKVDRASMANSLEVRPPLLDYRIVEFAFSLQDDLCIRDKASKYILKKLIKDKVPKDILNKPKQGFSCPIHQYWSVDDMLEGINKGRLLSSGTIDKAAWAKIQSGDVRHDHLDAKIWQIAVLEEWFSRWYCQDKK
ncbi:MAG: asparagine synthase (glutamine-hydrolyzing) [Candidatus Gorgyraea atricola]|nr:asparagine synthase (glutamine-hydrolyzing) [Candidatus Gorgyraea atricola]